jgi:DNA-binding NarL/FixJ family response regulator
VELRIDSAPWRPRTRIYAAVTRSIRILLAEGDAPTRAGLRLSVAGADLQVVAEAAAHADAVDAALAQRPDVALIAADLPGGGLDAARRLGDLLPEMRIIVLSSDPSGEELLDAVLAGAAGYLGKDMRLARLPHAIRGVVEGETALPRRHLNRLLQELRGRDIRRMRVAEQTNAKLTDREWDVLQLLGENASTAQMAQRLRISQVTVRRHISRVIRKLGVASRERAAEVVRRASE